MVRLGTIPFPFRSMLAICSDLDETKDLETYIETSRFLNGSDQTGFGKGLQLETGNTIYFDMPDNQFSYNNTTPDGQGLVQKLIRSGHIDCLHSYGDRVTTRDEVKACLAELERKNCRLKVWIDHAIAPSNFGADIMAGQGDDPASDVYHADLTLAHGIRFVSRGRVTSVVGQDAGFSLAGLFEPRLFRQSMATLTKEGLKHVLARMGSEKYAMHGTNQLLKPVNLRDGQDVMEFIRCNPHPCGVSVGDNARGLAEALTSKFFDTLVSRRGKSIVYTHLGKKIDSTKGFDDGARNALKGLRDRHSKRDILVTTTRRLLGFTEVCMLLKWSVDRSMGDIEIEIDDSVSRDGLQGINFIAPADANVSIRIGGERVETESAARPGMPDVMTHGIPWRRLPYPL